MAQRPTVISLFSGAGGLDYGFEAAGFETRVALEFDSNCCATLRQNREFPVIENDVRNVRATLLIELARLKAEEADVLIGGPPCQPFSKAGYWATGDTKRLDDPRADTLDHYMRMVFETQPKVFVLENVPGLAFGKKREGLERLLGRIEEINEATGANYQPNYQVLKAADFGVPQVRERLFIVASREGTRFEFPEPTHAPDDEERGACEPHRTAWDALGGLGNQHEPELELRGKWADLLPSIPEGTNYLWHTDRGEGLPLFGWRRRYWSFLLKLAKAGPSWTIQAQPGPAIGPFHWDNRRLSSRELCRLQTFPDDVEIVGNIAAVQKQLGNAVPSLLAEVLGRAIRTQLLDGKKWRSSLTLLPPQRTPIPAPRSVEPVADKYHSLVGEHSAHPGTGRGYSAAIQSP